MVNRSCRGYTTHVKGSIFDRKRLLFAACVLAGLLSVGIYLTMYQTSAAFTTLARCIESAPMTSQSFACVQQNVRAVLQDMPAADLMQKVERELPKKCHYIGHIIGKEIFHQSETVENAFLACGPGVCSRACIHGVTGEALFSAGGLLASPEELQHPSIDVLRDIGEQFCAQDGTCHAVGHALYTLFSDIPRSLKMCDEISSGKSAGMCYLGVFMENNSFIFDNTEMGPQTAKPFVESENLLYPCNIVESRYRPSCFQFLFLDIQKSLGSSPGADEGNIRDAHRKTCESLSDQRDRKACFNGFGWGLGSGLSSRQTLAPAEAQQICDRERTSDRIACTFGLSNGMVDMGRGWDPVSDRCASLDEMDLKEACYKGAFTAFHDRGEAYESTCDAIPDTVCKQSLESFISNPNDIPVPLLYEL